MTVTVKRKNPDALKKVYADFSKKADKEVAVGYPKGKARAYPTGELVADVAAKNVYGTSTIPKRDFMGLANVEIPKKVKVILQKVVKVSDPKERQALLEVAGQIAEAEIKKAITDLRTPPNAPSTIAAKGSSNPLIDTGHMRNSTTYIVRDRIRK